MAHESLEREEHVTGSTDRSFGIVFALVFLIIAAWPLWSGQPVRWWALAVACTFAVVAVAVPRVLAAPNRWWTKLGLLLGRVVSPVALGVLFYAVFVPTGLLMRILGKDPLRLKRDTAAPTYWIDREPPGPPPGSMTNQF